mmetsp:Transcript_8283/g.14662  ORF Transcript_8283/g.14662 Transcript_8283/m.14662 type:complete len:169 (+) Transcript_8283:94-600(+)|eukprot:CAMPEP_0184525298 /NCGR_PEP_ID=MMETSP0198_2-20121128/10018_1 /TAXON_ID=1112570 /ORGANISM="Thraustochytrium sp., Strain LLF1b" /LENGTH=168 /DNA_ID=CAMNT_0026916737 /DNA_START=62 /DNA_END=568 /DNA_ORIENTATION=+
MAFSGLRIGAARATSLVGRRANTLVARNTWAVPMTTARSMGTFKYLKSHEYVHFEDNSDEVKIGISDFAQSQLGDVVYVDLPAEGEEFDAGDSFGSVESVKAASDVYAPVTGVVLKSNEQLEDKAELVNTNAMSDGWFITMKMSNKAELDELMDEEAYQQFLKDEENH